MPELSVDPQLERCRDSLKEIVARILVTRGCVAGSRGRCRCGGMGPKRNELHDRSRVCCCVLEDWLERMGIAIRHSVCGGEPGFIGAIPALQWRPREQLRGAAWSDCVAAACVGNRRAHGPNAGEVAPCRRDCGERGAAGNAGCSADRKSRCADLARGSSHDCCSGSDREAASSLNASPTRAKANAGHHRESLSDSASGGIGTLAHAGRSRELSMSAERLYPAIHCVDRGSAENEELWSW